MIQVNVSRLIDAIKESEEFRLPDMNEGTDYLYNNVYKLLSRGEDVRLSRLDFDAFESEDVNTLNELHTEKLEKNRCAAKGIAYTLKRVTPVCKAVGYV